MRARILIPLLFGCTVRPGELFTAPNCPLAVGVRGATVDVMTSVPSTSKPIALHVRGSARDMRLIEQLRADGRATFQRHELDRFGLSPDQLSGLVRAGLVIRLGHGSYALSPAIDLDAQAADLDRHERERRWYLRRLSGVLAGVPGAYAIGPSAAVAHGFPVRTLPTDLVIAARPRFRPTRDGVVGAYAWGGPPVRSAAGILAQSPAETVVEVAARQGVADGLIVFDYALRLGHARAQVHSAIEAYGARTGVGHARVVEQLGDSRRESPAESLCALELHRGGIEAEPQVTIHDAQGFVARVDFLVRGTRIVIEVDGLSKYTSSEVLQAEKRRELRLQAAGYVVLRFGWQDITRRAPQLVRRVREEMYRAA